MFKMIEWNKVIYKDCMNEENGLPTLEDKIVDLCLTDPPFNIKIKKNSQKHHKNLNWKTPNKIIYQDNMNYEDYEIWCKKWFEELLRICEKIIITPGETNLELWETKIQYPIGKAIHYKRNCQGITNISYLRRFETILFYGKFNKRLHEDVFDIYLNNGFLRKGNFIHPCPKSYELWDSIISQLKPKSVIDPFLGSGTTAEVCTKLGISWLGYEINEVYSQDINKRLKNCKKEPKQITLF